MKIKDILLNTVVFGAVLVVALGLANAIPGEEPPIHYTDQEYAADKAVYMPGETLIYTPTLVIKREGRTFFLRTFWDDTRDGAARLCDGSDAPQDEFSRNLPRGIIGNARGGRQVTIVVPKLPPGSYRLLSSALKVGGGESHYEVPFRVERAC